MVKNEGADQDGSDEDERYSRSEATDEQSVNKGRRKWSGRGEYKLIKRWVTSECAEMEQEDIDREMFELAREYMEASKLK